MSEKVASSNEGASSRRNFLKGVAAAGAAAAAVMLPANAEAKKKKGVLVFRFKVRGTRHCNTCSIHHKYWVFLTPAFADGKRAHPFCNCPIVPQEISKTLFKKWFIKTGAIDIGSVDLRHLGRV